MLCALYNLCFMYWQMPGTIMAMGRLNRPSIMVYGGTIKVLGSWFDVILFLIIIFVAVRLVSFISLFVQAQAMGTIYSSS